MKRANIKSAVSVSTRVRRGLFSPAKKPGSIEKRTTRVHNLFIHSGLQENAPPLLEYLSSPIKAYGVRGLISYLWLQYNSNRLTEWPYTSTWRLWKYLTFSTAFTCSNGDSALVILSNQYLILGRYPSLYLLFISFSYFNFTSPNLSKPQQTYVQPDLDYQYNT